MKKVVVILALSLFTLNNFAQNLQVHYDMGEDRGYATTTLEMFKPDQWGSTFFFVDFDYNTDGGNSVSFAYMEIARGLKFWDNPFEIHVEYNGGTYLNDAWLFGGNYTWNSPDFNRIFTLQAMYKNIRDKEDASFQITGVWTMHFANKKFTFSGFADFWKEENTFDGKTTDFVFLSEPQIWFNAGQHLSLGGEVELASNFGGHKGFKVCPTVAVKWNF
jgi:hypothetical protein